MAANQASVRKDMEQDMSIKVNSSDTNIGYVYGANKCTNGHVYRQMVGTKCAKCVKCEKIIYREAK